MKRPHARIHLPPLQAHDALALVTVLERAIAAIWRAHGDAMADLQAACDVDTPLTVPATPEPDGDPF